MPSWFAVIIIFGMVENAKDILCVHISVQQGTPKPYMIALRASMFGEYTRFSFVEVSLIGDEDPASTLLFLEWFWSRWAFTVLNWMTDASSSNQIW